MYEEDLVPPSCGVVGKRDCIVIRKMPILSLYSCLQPRRIWSCRQHLGVIVRLNEFHIRDSGIPPCFFRYYSSISHQEYPIVSIDDKISAGTRRIVACPKWCDFKLSNSYSRPPSEGKDKSSLHLQFIHLRLSVPQGDR